MQDTRSSTAFAAASYCRPNPFLGHLVKKCGFWGMAKFENRMAARPCASWDRATNGHSGRWRVRFIEWIRRLLAERKNNGRDFVPAVVFLCVFSFSIGRPAPKRFLRRRRPRPLRRQNQFLPPRPTPFQALAWFWGAWG